MMRNTILHLARNTGQATVGSRLRRFQADEDGSIMVFSIFILLLMLMIGGMAVDAMRFENTRSRMQATLDRAVLAAANLSQSKEPVVVVEDYVSKAGMAEYLSGTTVTDNTLNARGVTATASAEIPSLFIHMMGIDTMTAPALSAAEEKVTNVEVSLVLDVSNSMNDNNRIGNLRTAGKDFVDIVLNGANTGAEGAPKISISLVPYSGQANAGAALLGTYPNRLYGQTYSYCVDWAAADYSTTAVANTAALVGASNGETYTSSTSTLTPSFYWCPKTPANVNAEIVTMGSNPTTLKNIIGAMTAQGSTAIDIGMKWGVTLLDPSTQPSVTSLIAQTKVPALFAGRPYSYEEPNTMKVIVLMTDGSHVNHEPRMINTVKTGNSNVWLNTTVTGANAYSLYDSTKKQWWWKSSSSWKTYPYGGSSSTTCNAANATCSNARKLGYPELWDRANVGWVSSQLYSPAYGTSSTAKYNEWVQSTPNTTKDTRTKAMCAAAKAKGITIFSVAFEADGNGQSLLKYCATTSGHYFDVQGLEIRAAFRSIASHISQLRLTQ